MSIDYAGLRLQSETLTTVELAELAGGMPSKCVQRGARVSSHLLSSPVHAVSMVFFDSSLELDGLSDLVSGLRSHLDRLSGRSHSHDVAVDLVISITGSPMGFMTTLEPEWVQLLCAASCGIVLDVYSE